MKRPAASENTLHRINQWRQICPDLTIRSTFIVGFPGETEQDFEDLLDFLDEAQLDRVGCFQYSPVDGARANSLPNPVEESVKQERWERFMEKQQQISRHRLALKIGRRLEAIIDEKNEEGYLARSSADAPEIDGVVYVETDKVLRAGDRVAVEITDSDAYDLHGRTLEAGKKKG